MFSEKNHNSSFFFKYFQAFLFIFLLFSFIPTAKGQEIYITPEFTYKPIWSDSPITLYFKPNEQLCKENYAEKWQEKCFAYLGKVGTNPENIIADNWPEGRFEWTGSDKLTFYPNKSWKSGTEYKVDLSQMEFPSRVKFSSQNASFTSLPRSVQFDEGKVWVDPSPRAEHAFTFSMRFTESLSDEMKKTIDDDSILYYESEELVMSKSDWIWLDNNTRVVINTKILSLPKQDSTVSLEVAHARPLWYEDNFWHFPDKVATKDLIIPGTNSLLSLQEVKLDNWQNKALAMEKHLVFRFSQQVSGAELLKALTVIELPLHRSEENIIPTNWSKGGIDNSIKNNARKIKPELVQIPGENAEYIRFRLDTKPEHYIYWNIAKGFGQVNDQGIATALDKDLNGVEYIPQGRPRLDILQAGNVLMADSDLALLSEDIDQIRWHAHRFKDNALALPYFNTFNYSLSRNELNANTIVLSGEITLPKTDKTQTSYSSKPIFSTLSSNKIFADNIGKTKPGLIYLVLEGFKDGKEVASTERLLINSNMGLVLKKLPNSAMEVYVCAMDTATALDGIKVQVLGQNGLPLAEVKTDQSGKAVLPDLSKFSREKTPTALLLHQSSWGSDKDILWISLNDYTRNINTSEFMDIQGRQSGQNSLNAFVFAERGLFRPGEVLNFGTLLRANDWKLLPANLPLLATIFDSANRKIYQKSFMAGENIHSFAWEIPQNAPTGFYKLTISTPGNKPDELGIILGSNQVQVEMFVPDTLKISTELVQTKNNEVQTIPNQGWFVSNQETGNTALKVQLKTLFGQAATNRRITSEMRLYPANLNFAGYEDYIFQDSNPFFSGSADPINRPLSPTITDNHGEALLPLDFSQWRFGTLQCFISTQGFEPDGGRAVTTEKRFLLSPMPYMLGYKAGDYADNMDFITKNNPAKLQFIAVDPSLNPINAGKLSFSLSRRKPVTSLVTNAQGLYSYTESIVDEEISKEEQSVNQDGSLIYNLPTQEVGEFLLTVKEAKDNGLVLARVPFSIVGNDDLRPALLSAQELPSAKLHIKTDKKSYQGGDVAKVMLTAPYAGVALLSLERDKVSSYKWIKIPMGNSLHELNIPKDFVGRGYIQVLMGRDPKSDEIFLQSQGFAMSSIIVNAENRKIPLKIDVPDEVQPGKPLNFKLENTAGKATKAIVYAVDEGILQLSTYSTPKPLDYLLFDRALEVATAQLFDRIMPSSEKIMKRLSAFGGDYFAKDAFSALLGTFQNPFKRGLEAPLTWWSGVIDIPVGGIELQIPIPSYYNGNVRIMAIAQTDHEVGSLAENVIVQAEQVLTPQLPSTVSLGDNFEAALAIANTTDTPIKLALELNLDEQSQTKDLSFTNFPKSISLEAKEEKVIAFQINIGNMPGSATINFRAKDENNQLTERKAYLSVRPATLPSHTQKSLTLNQSMAINLNRQMLPYNAQTSITLSPIPMPLLNSSLNYLQNYPYNCVEQIVSKAFALAALKNTSLYQEVLAGIPSINEESLEKNMDRAYSAIISAYSSYSGVSMWTDRSAPDIFLTAYVADYLLTLKDANLPVPPSLMPQLFDTLERRINQSPNSIESLRAYAYASWVLARAGYVVSQQLEMCASYLERYEIENSDVSHSLMAGAYKAIFMEEEAQKYLAKVKGDAPKSWENSSDMFDLLAQYGLHATVLAKHFPQEFTKAIPFLQEAFINGFNKPHATLGASMSALGLMEIIKSYANQNKNMEDVEVNCTNYAEVANNNEESFAESYSNFFQLDAPNCTRFDVKIPKGQKLFAQIQEYGYNEKMPNQVLAKGIALNRSYTNISTDLPFDGTVEQGDVLRVDIEIGLMSNSELPIVLIDLLPGGFELVLNHEDDSQPQWDLSLYREEDRVIAYVDASKKKKNITYHIRAINKGNFALPAVYAEGLFDRNLQSHGVGGQVKVVLPRSD